MLLGVLPDSNSIFYGSTTGVTEADVEHSIAILQKMGVRDIDRFTYIIRNH